MSLEVPSQSVSLRDEQILAQISTNDGDYSAQSLLPWRLLFELATLVVI